MKNGLILILFFLFALNAHAMARTNINEVTDLFEVNIENKEQEFRELQKNNDNALENIRSENGLKLVPAMDGDVNGKIAELNAIKDTNLDDAGREKRGSEEYRFYDENEFEPSYTKPGNKMHREDAMTIAIGSRKKLDELLVELHKIGVDCKTVKGPKQKEPTFFIDLNRVPQKNTDYDLHLCELLRNKYNCTDTLSMSCKTKVMQWEDWQDRTIDFGGADIYWNLVGWMYSYKWDDSEFGLHIKQEPHVMADIGREIAKRIGATTDQVAYVATIMPPLHPFRLNTPGKGFGEIFHLEKKSYTWEIFKFSYKYREGKLVCGEWNEDWTEECKLQ